MYTVQYAYKSAEGHEIVQGIPFDPDRRTPHFKGEQRRVQPMKCRLAARWKAAQCLDYYRGTSEIKNGGYYIAVKLP